MRRVLAVAVSLVAIFGIVAPASAQVPAPRVTINGLVDFVTSAYRNWSGGGSCLLRTDGIFANQTCPAGDVTNNRDKGWYSRERGVLTITGELGRTKGVWAFEFDFTNGVNGVGQNAGNGLGQAGTPGNSFPGTTTGSDFDTDIAGALETKWLYLETPIFGPGSIAPFVPVDTLVRAGLQPSTGHDYKVGILLSGDIPGVALISNWAPNLRSTVTFAQGREGLDKKLNNNTLTPFILPGQTPSSATSQDPRSATARGQESWAIVSSVELDVFKGLTVKPTYAYADFEGGSGNRSLGRPGVNGFDPNGSRAMTHRHTLGGDVRWTSGPFYVQPTAYYQWGDQDICTVDGGPMLSRISVNGVVANQDFPSCPTLALTNKRNVNIRTWIIDTSAGFRTGPLNIEVRGMVTPGMSAQRQVQNGADVGYYQSINPGFGYMAGWSSIQAGGVDYITQSLIAAPGVAIRTSPSYDKYGRRWIAFVADYNLTTALTLHGILNASWTDQKVDRTAVLTTGGLAQTGGGAKGTDRYLGTELATGFTYRFAPNVSFDLEGAYEWTGHAMDHAQTIAESLAGIHHNARDIYKGSARVRFTF